jgi:hypothetical protein
LHPPPLVGSVYPECAVESPVSPAVVLFRSTDPYRTGFGRQHCSCFAHSGPGRDQQPPRLLSQAPPARALPPQVDTVSSLCRPSGRPHPTTRQSPSTPTWDPCPCNGFHRRLFLFRLPFHSVASLLGASPQPAAPLRSQKDLHPRDQGHGGYVSCAIFFGYCISGLHADREHSSLRFWNATGATAAFHDDGLLARLPSL